MLWESSFYKQELLSLRKKIKYLSQKFKKLDLDDEKDCLRFDALYGKIELSVFMCAFIIRKLLESKKLSDELEGHLFTVEKYLYHPQEHAGSKKHVDIMNNHRFHEFYNLEGFDLESQSLQVFTNKIRHSFIFSIVYNNCKLEGFFYNSDHTKHKELYYIDFKTFDNLLKRIIKDDIWTIYFQRNKEGLMEITKKSSVFCSEEALAKRTRLELMLKAKEEKRRTEKAL